MSTPKPCPFCGSTVKAVRDAAVWWVECAHCGADGPVNHSKQEAVRRWNIPRRGGHADE